MLSFNCHEIWICSCGCECECGLVFCVRTRPTLQNISVCVYTLFNNNNHKSARILAYTNTRGKCDVISSAFITFTVSNSSGHTHIARYQFKLFYFFKSIKMKSNLSDVLIFLRFYFISFHFISFCCRCFFIGFCFGAANE